jgi:hypothetical protein
MGCIESNALAPRHLLLLHRMTWMSRIGGSLAEFNSAASETLQKNTNMVRPDSFRKETQPSGFFYSNK